MKELIKIKKSLKTGNPVVNARDLYVFLETKEDFSTWLKSRLKKYRFVENVDYARIFYNVYGERIPLHKNMETDNQRVDVVHRIDYALTLDCAKELSMVQNNEKGRQARRYFIEKEKEFWVLKDGLAKKLEIKYSMSEVARTLNLVDFYGKVGRNSLYNILYFRKIVDVKNQPFPKYVKKGYFTCKPTRVTETGLRWLSQMFDIGSGENIELKERIEKIETEQELMLDGVTALVETLLYNKGGKLTEDKNRLAVSHLRNYLDKTSNRKKLLAINN